MKKRLTQMVAILAAMIFFVTSVTFVTPVKAFADTGREYHKVTGLKWGEGADDKYVGYWDAYDFPGEDNTKWGYFVILCKNGHYIIDSSSSSQKPGPVYYQYNSYDFKELIKKNGPGEYTFVVSAYVYGDTLNDLPKTKSDASAVKTVEGEKYKLNISVSPIDTGRVSVNGAPVEGYGVEAFQYQDIVLKAEPTAGFKFSKWTSGDGEQYTTGSFWMPDREIEVCAEFEGYHYCPNPRWYEGSFVANWNKYEGCRNYCLNLYKDGTQVGDSIWVNDADAESYDFTSLIEANGKGTYKFDLQAVFADSTRTLLSESGTIENDNSSEIENIGFSLNKSNITTLLEGNSAGAVKSELSALYNANNLISGLNSIVKLDSSDPIRLTKTTLVSSELEDSAIIEKEKEYCLCFHFIPNKEGDTFASTVVGPAGEATLMREDANNCYVYWPIKSGSSGGSTPTPGPTPGPDPTPTPNPSLKQNYNETSVMTDEQRAEELQRTIEETIAAEEALPVTAFTSAEAISGIPVAAKNTGATYNLSKITTPQGFAAAITKIAASVKANATNRNRTVSITVYTEKPMTFCAEILDAIYAADIEFSYVFRYEGKLYKITIPRGVKVDFGGSRYEGPLYVGKILGTTQVIE